MFNLIEEAPTEKEPDREYYIVNDSTSGTSMYFSMTKEHTLEYTVEEELYFWRTAPEMCVFPSLKALLTYSVVGGYSRGKLSKAGTFDSFEEAYNAAKLITTIS